MWSLLTCGLCQKDTQFEDVDIDENAYISPFEFEYYYKKKHNKLPNHKDWTNYMNADLNHDKYINYKEFKLLFDKK